MCGVLLDSSGQSYCDDCTPGIQHEHGGDYARIGLDTLAQLRTQGIYPAHGGTAAARRAERLAANQSAIAEWEADPARSSSMGDENGHGTDRGPALFANELRPQLQEVFIEAMARATGLSKGYCSFVRRGLKTPHPRHWPIFEALADASGHSDQSARKDAQ
jgi:hypothetical protein